MSKIVEIKNLKFEVENYDTKLNIAEFVGKFTSVDLRSLEVQYKYPKCNNTVSTDDENAKCGKCATVTIGDQCRSNSNVKGIVMDAERKLKYPVSMKQKLLKEIVYTPIKIKTVKNLLLTSYCFYYQHTWWGSHQCCCYIKHFLGVMFFIIPCWNPFSTSILFNPSQINNPTPLRIKMFKSFQRILLQ